MAEARLQDVCGVLLCGGTGQRLGGVDKPLLDGGNASLAQQALARLAGKLDEWVVSANRNRARYAAFGHPVVADARTDEGPLAGIAAAAGATEREWLYVQPGDAPAPDARLPAALRAQAGAHDAVVLRTGDRQQTLPLLVRRSCALALDAELRNGLRAVHRWLASLDLAVIELDVDMATWINVNTPDELAAWRARSAVNEGAGA